jgi:hypothetical protein
MCAFGTKQTSRLHPTLHASPWLAPMPKELEVSVFDVIHEILVGHREQAA